MGPDAQRLIRAGAALAVATLAIVATSQPVSAAAWWEPVAFAGQRVDAVAVDGTAIVVDLGGSRHVSVDGGRNFRLAPSPSAAAGPPVASVVVSDGHVWAIRDGEVLTGSTAAALARDPRAPSLGAAAHLLAAPAATPGVVGAVGSDGHVWRRGQDGAWATAFALLPAGGFTGVPKVTGLTAFTQPLSAAIYLGTDGYGVLISSDGGDDWVRAGPGLPDSVLGLAADNATRSVFAATADGLWVHHLQAFPAPPVYHDAALYQRWLGVAAVALVATMLAVGALRWALPASGAPRR